MGFHLDNPEKETQGRISENSLFRQAHFLLKCFSLFTCAGLKEVTSVTTSDNAVWMIDWLSLQSTRDPDLLSETHPAVFPIRIQICDIHDCHVL